MLPSITSQVFDGWMDGWINQFCQLHTRWLCQVDPTDLEIVSFSSMYLCMHVRVCVRERGGGKETEEERKTEER